MSKYRVHAPDGTYPLKENWTYTDSNGNTIVVLKPEVLGVIEKIKK